MKIFWCMTHGVCPNCGMPLADELECEYCDWKKNP